ncbi:MAG: AAA family ATPase [Thermoplasmata archaeon]|nr:AAA family ATPase [Thermoplasmata archaeon]
MRIRTGISGFDDLIQGGLVPNRVYIVAGPPGSGKSTFGVQFLIQGAREGERGLFVSLTEDPKSLIEDMSTFNFGLRRYTVTGMILFVDMGPLSIQYFQAVKDVRSIGHTYAQEVFKKISAIVKTRNIKRLVIDSILTLKFGSGEREEQNREIARFFRSLKDLKVTTLILSEMTDLSNYSPEHYLSHGVIFLHNFLNGHNMVRAIQVIKMRGTKHNCDMYKMDITADGIRVYPTKV